MANPYGMTEFSVPALIGLNEQLKGNRLEQLYRQKQLEFQDKQQARLDRADQREEETRKVYSSIFAPPGSSGASSEGGVAGESATSPPAQPSSTITQLDPAKIRALAATGPEGLKAAQSLMTMNADQIKSAQEAVSRVLELKGRIIGGIRVLPTDQREAAYQRERATLIANGTDPSTLPPHWDENQADMLVRQSMSAAEALGMDDKARHFAEQVRHNRATEGVAAGNLSLSQQREARVKQWGPQPLIGVIGGAKSNTDDLDY